MLEEQLAALYGGSAVGSVVDGHVEWLLGG